MAKGGTGQQVDGPAKFNGPGQTRWTKQRESAEESEDGMDGEVSSESESDAGSGRESACESVGFVRRVWSGISSLYKHLLPSHDSCNSCGYQINDIILPVKRRLPRKRECMYVCM